MAENKTQKNDLSVTDFLNSVPDEQKRRDSFAIMEMMKQASGAEPKMWGPAIIGFGDAHYKYESGREGDWFKVGFSPRKQNLTLYLMGGAPSYPDLLGKLGKYKTGKGCLYINKLTDVDVEVLREMISRSMPK
jgi:hypothetical protein